MERLKQNKDLLESGLEVKLKQILDQRAALDRLEHRAVEEMLEKDKEYQAQAGVNLEETIRSPITAIHSTAPTEEDARSTSDYDDGVTLGLCERQVAESDDVLQDIVD